MEVKDGPATRRSSHKGRPHRNWPKGTGAGESLGWDGEHHSKLEGREERSDMKKTEKREGEQFRDRGKRRVHTGRRLQCRKGKRENSSEYSFGKRAVHSEGR